MMQPKDSPHGRREPADIPTITTRRAGEMAGSPLTR